MKKPNLDLMWRTWIKIGSTNDLTLKVFQDTIREKISGILKLQKTGRINWFYFLYHNKPDDSDNGCFDVVFTSNLKDPNKILPNVCPSFHKNRLKETLMHFLRFCIYHH